VVVNGVRLVADRARLTGLERLIAAARAELAKGRAASLDQVVAYALEGVGGFEKPASR
jgi:hypothetical protein